MIKGVYFSSQNSSKQEVSLYIDANAMVRIDALDIAVPLEKVEISTRIANTERIISLEDGSVFHTLENDALDKTLKQHNHRFSLSHLFESRWRYAIASLVLMLGFVWFSLTSGATIASNIITPLIPQGTLNDVSVETLAFMDKHILKPSELNTSVQKVITKHFADLTYGKPKYKLHFRTSSFFKENAFALPSGDIVITDPMVHLSADPQYRDILGVLAHECGHVEYRHAIQSSIKTTVSGAIIAFFVGDFSTIAVGVSTFLMNNHYSQAHERQADAYAVEQLTRRGISSKHLAVLFEKLAKQEEGEEKAEKEEHNFFSSHPLTDERIRYFNNAQK